MSFTISFFARDAYAARSKLQNAYAPAAVKALVELALAGIPADSVTPNSGAGVSGGTSAADGAKSQANGPANATAIPRRRLCGIRVETSGHIDEHGERSWINSFRVEPCYD